MVVRDEGYQGNPNLLRAGTVYAYTQAEKDEYRKCHDDSIYFIESYVKIVTLDDGIVPFKPWDFQKEMLRNFDKYNFNICKLPRQVGKSTVSVSYILHYILFNEYVEVAILANKAATARQILGRLKLAYEKLPKFLQAGIKKWNDGSIELGNGSKIYAESTSSDSIRGYTFNLIFLDEFAFVPHNIAEDFFNATYPTISSGKNAKMIIVSTPKGLNLFHKMWKKAIDKKSEYHPFEVHWSMVPGRDQAWKEKTIRNTSERQFRQEFECDFLGSEETLISGSQMSIMNTIDPIYTEGDLKVYEKPEVGRSYVVNVDTSEGIGKDYHFINVTDVSEWPYKQVACWRNNEMPVMLVPNVIKSICESYNNAYLMIELNNLGQQVSDILRHDLEYEHMFTTISDTQSSQHMNFKYSRSQKYGMKMTSQSKRIGCDNLKSIIENGKYIINDEKTLDELKTFIVRRNSYMAEEGKNDDSIMTLVQFGWMSNQQVFKDQIDSDIRKLLQNEQSGYNEEPEIPFMITPTSGMADPFRQGVQNSFADDEGDRWFPA